MNYTMATCSAIDNAFSKSEKAGKTADIVSREIENVENAFYSLLDRMYENMPDCPDNYRDEVESDVGNSARAFKRAVEVIKETIE